MNDPLKWRNLKENKCPKCDEDLAPVYDESTDMFVSKCGFKITQTKFLSITRNMITQELEDKWNKEYQNEQAD